MFSFKNRTMETCSGLINKIDLRCDYLFFAVIAAFAFAGLIILMLAGVCWYTVYRHSKKDVESFSSKPKILRNNPSFSMKPSSIRNGDRRLAHSAQMYHYQHQKQQMIAIEKSSNEGKQESEDHSEVEAEEGDYTVYECPGLAPTSEMVVKNPLFSETVDKEDVNNNNEKPNGSVTIRINEAFSIDEK